MRLHLIMRKWNEFLSIIYGKNRAHERFVLITFGKIQMKDEWRWNIVISRRFELKFHFVSVVIWTTRIIVVSYDYCRLIGTRINVFFSFELFSFFIEFNHFLSSIFIKITQLRSVVLLKAYAQLSYNKLRDSISPVWLSVQWKRDNYLLFCTIFWKQLGNSNGCV